MCLQLLFSRWSSHDPMVSLQKPLPLPSVHTNSSLQLILTLGLPANLAQNGSTQSVSASNPSSKSLGSTFVTIATRRPCVGDGFVSPRGQRLWRPRVHWRVRKERLDDEISLLLPFTVCVYMYISTLDVSVKQRNTLLRRACSVG